MTYNHNNISDDLIRQREENFNENFINSLGINLDISQYEGKQNKDIGNDSTPYMTVWLKNIDRLMGLIPSDIKLENYHLCDVGCGLGVSTIYLKKKYIYYKDISKIGIVENVIFIFLKQNNKLIVKKYRVSNESLCKNLFTSIKNKFI